ncbi:hypothetical protein LTR10_023050 [Elasticomyces elasticus]|uniref:Peptidase S9 prolyl oligopeptidase catalytic domain-containing protein n=1 Tax=Exophiala sideris TaxID=1016849 RepID=A0ABR0IWH8_9EURO|nr:hypothetical protein LTR10_023050 [Elasticomyces elasticus]KAK5021027.1 hypothetical protein LTS07_011282 [Exophiala sideris]KAK5023331.1 hypothetical protein LTR13_011243 [Exophiala sideris]KAK5048753.1 hypothetical protein LTR69_011299 [Exophiala sideris]KAK5176182.1 hypothetical protein LTR44_011277 [Eurotiomycetes sp. CCFEE 6388]
MASGSYIDSSRDETTIEVSGLQVHIRGCISVAFSKILNPDLVFLLHGRTSDAEALRDMGTAILAANPETLVVSFDQRNHGHRILNPKANLTWADGNDMHAQDMCLHLATQVSIQYGTSLDVSLLIDLLPMFISPDERYVFRHIFCVGVSLGGHATYHVLSNEPRVNAGVVIIGCPDTAALLQMRVHAKDSRKLMPSSFLATVRRLQPNNEEVAKKSVLIIKGNEDNLVPWEPSQTFVEQLPKARVQVIGYDGIGHALTKAMQEDTAKWIQDFRKRS